MADEKINIVVSLKDNASKAIKGMQDGLSKLKTASALLAVAGIGVLVSALKKCVDAYGDSEMANTKLKAALAATGQEVEGNVESMNKFAEEIQRVTTVEDDQAIALMQVAVNMGLTADQAKNATVAAVGLSSAYGVDLNSAIKMASAAQMGNYDMLKRTIPELKNIKDESELAARANQLLGASFEVAKAETQTYQGAMLQLKNATNTLMEDVGKLLAPALTWLAKVLTKAAEATHNLGKSWDMIKRSGDALKIVMIDIGQVGLAAVKKLLVVWNDFLNLLSKIPGVDINIDGAISKIDELDKKMQEKQVAIAERNLQEVENVKETEELKYQTKNQYIALSDEQEKLRDEMLAEKREQDMGLFTAFEDAKLLKKLENDEYMTKAELDRAKKLNDALKAQSQAYIGYVAQAAEEETNIAQAVARGTLEYIKDGIKKQILAKAAAITETGFALLIASLGTDPQAYAHIAAGGVLAAGGVAAVNSIQLAEGGIVMPTTGGTQATIGEAGSPEAVIPLDDPEAKGMLGGNNITVNISGKPLAKEMYELQQEMIRTGELSA